MGLFKDKGRVYKPVDKINLGPDSDEYYLRANVTAPRTAGFLIKIFVWVLESRIFGTLVVYLLKKSNLLHKHVSYAEIEEPPIFVPAHQLEDLKEKEVILVKPNLSPLEQVGEVMDCLPPVPQSTVGKQAFGFRHWTIRDYSRAYSSGETTPLKVAEKFVFAVKESCTPHLQMAFFIDYNVEDILRQTTLSTLRYKEGKPISILDGVLIAVKDEIDCMPYPTTGGTKWLHKCRPCPGDACCIRQLRSCGAILVGKTNMHELGIGATGINPNYGVARNPYDRSRVCGGSSSGSAAVVGAGLCPVTLGVDGGGSVRIPAALCGVVGFKPTFGRLSHSGVLPLNWTVGMLGVLSGTVEDALIIYAAISGHMSPNQPTNLLPSIYFPVLKSTNSISNIKMAKYNKWFNDSNDDIRSSCNQALDQLNKHYGWKTVEVTLPEIEEMRLAHYSTIASECSASLSSLLEKINPSEQGWEARLALRVYSSFTSQEYLNAQRLRSRQMYFHKEIFKRADVIVTPTTGVTAYPIRNDAVKYGELDYINGAAIMRFQIAGNFLGLPAITVKVGYDKHGMPIGLQFIGRPWSEATLLHLAYALEGLCSKNSKKPQIYFDLLRKE